MKRQTAYVVAGVCGAAVVNYIIANFTGDLAFNVGRAVVCFAGGWLIVSNAHASLWAAASIGPLVMFVDHVVLKGGFFVLAHYLWPTLVQGEGLTAAAGVAFSYVLFLPIVALCSFAGGFAARRKAQHAEAHP